VRLKLKLPYTRTIFTCIGCTILLFIPAVLASPFASLPKPHHHLRLKQAWLNNKEIDTNSVRTINEDYASLELLPDDVHFRKGTDTFRYRINGWSEEWSAVPVKTSIRINRLPVGKYQLEIDANSTVTQGLPAVFDFEIASNWYERPDFLLFIIVLLFLACCFTLFYKRSAEKKNRLLQENMQRLQKANEHLSASKAVNEKLFSLIMHDIRSPLLFLETLCDLIIKANYKSESDLKAKLSVVRDSAGKITTMSESILQWITLQQNQFTPNKKQHSLLSLIETVVSIYKPIAQAHNVQLELSVPQNITVYTDPDMFVAITRNLIDNSIKFSKNGRIIIQAQQNNQQLELSIRDTGPGFTNERLDFIKSIINNPLKGKDSIKTSGFGLMIVSEFIHILGIQCHVENNHGAKFTLVFPTAAQQ